jgi:hypothetical protein
VEHVDSNVSPTPGTAILWYAVLVFRGSDQAAR